MPSQTPSEERALVHVTDNEPGIRRRRFGRGFAFYCPQNRRLTGAERARVLKLGIPPAYRDVWICPDPRGHLQATGRDARGRKQYIYHPLWADAQAETKYGQLAGFAEALPAIRRRIQSDLRGEAGDKAFTVAALVMLLDRGYLRIGNPTYTAQNRSFGATTLLRRHLRLRDGVVELGFRAKGGKRVRQTLRDKRLHKVLQQIGDLPGRNLFTYLSEDGQACPIGSADVNAYLTGVAGSGITAKTFRTWGGSLAAFETAMAAEADCALSIRDLAEAAAKRLHNTATISRKSYIHPDVLGLAALSPAERLDELAALRPAPISGLRRNEARLHAFLTRTAPDRRGKSG
ncbi:DNA topoisomerase IB [Rhodobacter sp. ETT8]|uniref:DNA topoisomerase n=1 Tax=Pseudotabrizicola algicola TaxID=2709381 RepID=A0A6B3RRY8_9RHOB|nr:DNA topoisomerase IB [Pseudotabrizicola algicola]